MIHGFDSPEHTLRVHPLYIGVFRPNTGMYWACTPHMGLYMPIQASPGHARGGEKGVTGVIPRFTPNHPFHGFDSYVSTMRVHPLYIGVFRPNIGLY